MISGNHPQFPAPPPTRSQPGLHCSRGGLPSPLPRKRGAERGMALGSWAPVQTDALTTLSP